MNIGLLSLLGLPTDEIQKWQTQKRDSCHWPLNKALKRWHVGEISEVLIIIVVQLDLVLSKSPTKECKECTLWGNHMLTATLWTVCVCLCAQCELKFEKCSPLETLIRFTGIDSRRQLQNNQERDKKESDLINQSKINCTYKIYDLSGVFEPRVSKLPWVIWYRAKLIFYFI